jgi:predicted nucleotidyltransferase
MDVLDESLLNFWRLMNRHEVAYIMIGGVAVNLHGYSRSTDDIDVWLEDTLENRRKLEKVLGELGYASLQLETFPFIPGWTNFYIGEGLELDIITSMKGMEGLSFTHCLQAATTADIAGVKVPFLHINHLIANKKAVNRLRDQVDVAELERIRLYREASGNG